MSKRHKKAQQADAALTRWPHLRVCQERFRGSRRVYFYSALQTAATRTEHQHDRVASIHSLQSLLAAQSHAQSLLVLVLHSKTLSSRGQWSQLARLGYGLRALHLCAVHYFL